MTAPLLTLAPADWKDSRTMYDLPDLPDAQCADADPAELTPELDELPTHLARAVKDEAIAHCIGCPELVRCMAEAEAQDYPYGAWGGRWWDGAPTDVAIFDAPVPATRVRSSSRERVA